MGDNEEIYLHESQEAIDWVKSQEWYVEDEEYVFSIVPNGEFGISVYCIYGCLS